MRWLALSVAGAVLIACLPELNKVDGPASGGSPNSGGAGSGGANSGGAMTTGGSSIGGIASGGVGGAGKGGSGVGEGGEAGNNGGTVDCSTVLPNGDPGAIAVGASGTALQWDGMQWLDANSAVGTLRAVWGSSPTDVWAFGDSGAGAHWDGLNWAPGFESGSITVERITGNGTHAWVLNETDGLFQFDGANWLPMAGPPQQIRDIWVSPSGKLYASLGSDSIYVRDTSGSWMEFANVGDASTMGVLSGTADSDIWFYVWTDKTFRRWNGATFGTYPTPPATAAPRALSTGPDAAWAVGDNGMVWSFIDGSWVALDSDTTRILYGVARHGPDKAWVVGDGGTILHVDGTSVCPVTSGTTQPLYAVWSP